MAPVDFKKRIVNFRPEVYDLIQDECAVRRNGGKGFSLTLNQIVLEYFELVTPKGVALASTPEGKPILTVEEEQVLG